MDQLEAARDLFTVCEAFRTLSVICESLLVIVNGERIIYDLGATISATKPQPLSEKAFSRIHWTPPL